MLSYMDKRYIRIIMIGIIQANKTNGINTRTLITQVLNNVSASIPAANRHHISGMIAWVLASTSHQLIVRTPGYSVII